MGGNEYRKHRSSARRSADFRIAYIKEKNKMSKMGNYVMGLQEEQDICPDCDEGIETVTAYKPHSFSRDVGEPYEYGRMCETCSGSGFVDREDEDEA